MYTNGSEGYFNMKKQLILFLVFCAIINLTSCTGQAPSTNKGTNEFNTSKDAENPIRGIEYITDKNRHLIGTEIIIHTNVPQENDERVTLPYKNIINSIDEKIWPSSINDFIVKEENNNYITPEIIGENGSVGIFTKEDGSGWNLNKGQSLTFNFNKYESRFQSIRIGYILNGKMMMKGKKFKELSGSYTLTANESGQYYIYVEITSTDYVAFKQGNIVTSG